MRGGTIPAARLLHYEPSGRFQLYDAGPRPRTSSAGISVCSAAPAADRARIVRRPMPTLSYRYELRRGEEVLATGHLTDEQLLEIGERIAIGGMVGIVRAIEPAVGGR